MENSEELTVKEFAKKAGVTPAAVYIWILNKRIKARNLNEGKKLSRTKAWRIPFSEFLRLKEEIEK